MRLIETRTLTSNQSSIQFDLIPQSFSDLKIVLSLRGTDNSIASFPNITFNGSGSNYSIRTISANGATPASQLIGSILWVANGATATANSFGNTEIYISNYSALTTKLVSIDSVSANNATTSLQYIIGGTWADVTPITSILISNSPNSFVAGSTVSLYAIPQGSDGIVTTS